MCDTSLSTLPIINTGLLILVRLSLVSSPVSWVGSSTIVGSRRVVSIVNCSVSCATLPAISVTSTKRVCFPSGNAEPTLNIQRPSPPFVSSIQLAALSILTRTWVISSAVTILNCGLSTLVMLSTSLSPLSVTNVTLSISAVVSITTGNGFDVAVFPALSSTVTVIL
ncbi:hypothetical protein NGUA31_03852 [Salmonella enterica]|nr:hypothetical protein NGUA06_02271 [Salmonella enterica]GAR29991.1 hypothetical protein NGUA08_02864 [Salmonella enterica]GAR58736.1 hypothetical protein NGUA15_00479 [Salmonella enterica]GAR69342.1 hypothetical protein NGUA17_01520 [Salmonella enterica]GAR81203.1 hypothetical protein NGUA19_04261 [Salmonella enterica]